jgi:hypothetical protein
MHLYATTQGPLLGGSIQQQHEADVWNAVGDATRRSLYSIFHGSNVGVDRTIGRQSVATHHDGRRPLFTMERRVIRLDWAVALVEKEKK